MANNAKNLQFQYNYTGEGYLDAKMSVKSITELINKWDFEGQSVNMPTAFMGNNDIPYPLDFWLVPYGEIDKWEIKTMPSIASLDDFESFKTFVRDFENQAGYYPMSNGTKVLVAGEEYEFYVDENGNVKWVSSQEIFDETISDAIKMAVDEVTSGASDAFDTLKEIEDWIAANSGNTSGAEGKSAYQIWLEAGNEGTEADFLASLKGEKGALDEEQIRAIYTEWDYGQKLAQRKEDVMRLIEEKGKLTEEIKNAIINATKLAVIEDIYRPFKEKKKTRATEAKKKGLEPLANYLLSFPTEGDVMEEAQKYVTVEVTEEMKKEGTVVKNAEDLRNKETDIDRSYHGFEEQLLWRYEDLKERYSRLLRANAPVHGDDYFSKNDYRYSPIDCFNTLSDVYRAMEIVKEDLEENFVWNDFCGANFSKYLVSKTQKLEGKILVFLKPCDTYSFNQLLTEHRFDREKVYAVGIPCEGMADINKIKAILKEIINKEKK